jgi:hypothetical protein
MQAAHGFEVPVPALAALGNRVPEDSAADYVAACRVTDSQLPAMAACCHAW